MDLRPKCGPRQIEGFGGIRNSYLLIIFLLPAFVPEPGVRFDQNDGSPAGSTQECKRLFLVPPSLPPSDYSANH